MRRCAFLPLLLLPLSAHAEVKQGWCVIVGSVAYDRFDEAAKLAERARAAGAEGAGVYDPRDFSNLAWGALAVIAVSGLPDSKAAEAAARPLRKAKLDADVKQCRPIKAAAAPVADKRKLAPEDDPPKGAPARYDDVGAGCFAYSPPHQAVACLTGEETSNGSGYAVVFFGETRASVEIYSAERKEGMEGKPDAATRRKVEKALADGKYTPMALTRRTLDPNTRLDWVIPRFAVEWKRKTFSGNEDMSGSSVQDSITVRCGARKNEPLEIIGTQKPYARTASGSVTVIPGGKLVVIELDLAWEMEGENGLGNYAMLFDLDSCADRGSSMK